MTRTVVTERTTLLNFFAANHFYGVTEMLGPHIDHGEVSRPRTQALQFGVVAVSFTGNESSLAGETSAPLQGTTQ